MQEIDEDKIREVTGLGNPEKVISYIVNLLDRLLESPIKFRNNIKWENKISKDNEPYQINYIEKIVFYERDLNAGTERMIIEKLQQFYPDWEGKQFVGDDEADRGIMELDDIVRLFVTDINYLIGYHSNPRMSNVFFSEDFENGEYWICVVVMQEVIDRNLGFIHPYLLQALKKRSKESIQKTHL